jgi:hypothetical protein
MRWNAAGTITTAMTALGLTGRDVATVDALATAYTVKLSPPLPGPYAMLLRFRSDGNNNDQNVLQMYAARGSDHYHRIAQLTLDQGQQIQSGSIYFVDTITPASEDALFDGEESNLTDMIGHYYVRTLACDRFNLIATTLSTTTVYVDVCWVYE